MIERITNEIHKCDENQCYLAALCLALTLPDICGKAEYPQAGNTERYIKWYNTYIGNNIKPSDEYGRDMPYSSGELIYNMRNCLLHEGFTGIIADKVKEDRCKVDELVLTVSDDYDNGFCGITYGKDNKIVKRMLEINIRYLYRGLCSAAKRYYDNNKEKFTHVKIEVHDIRHAFDSIFETK